MNAMSLAERSHRSLDEMVREMTTQLGLPSSQMAALDAHSTIAIQIHDLPDVMLSALDDRLWIWSLLPQFNEDWLQDHAAAVLPILTTAIEGVEGGQPTLGIGEHGYEWKAMVNLDQLRRDSGLLTVFQGFATQLGRLCQALELKGN